MEPFHLKRDKHGRIRLEPPSRGIKLLRDPLYTKGTAFSAEERVAFGLEGLLPHAVNSLEQQRQRVYDNITRKSDPLERYIGLEALQDRNEHLFYALLTHHIEEFLPIVYTPTVGYACQQYSRIFRRARGLWITPEHRGRIEHVLRDAPFDCVRLIVVTDNERILGLGDQGAGGMGIPIGKLALYTAAAGIPPWETLPISLDVGTDNEELLEDELYLGWRFPRLRGQQYDDLVDEFVTAVKRCFPRALLQWEDFKKGNAFRLLDRYRRTLPSFNDDIQGTAAVAVAGMLSGVRATGVPLSEQRVVVLGAGAAGVGIARLIRETLKRDGVPEDALVGRMASLDSQGLLVDDRELDEPYKRDFAWPAALAEARGLGPGRPRDLAAVVRALRPTVLFGMSGLPGAFTEEIVREMASHVERPLILPMSNPTSKCEATPQQILDWTDGRALVATGSPFEPVQHGGRTIRVGQGNNAFVFPGIGLGVLVAEAGEVGDALFAAAADCLAAQVSEDDLREGSLYPSIGDLRRITAGIAAAVVRAARDSNVGRAIPDDRIEDQVRAAMWEPVYAPMDASPG
jgi:malic enzyme